MATCRDQLSSLEDQYNSDHDSQHLISMFTLIDSNQDGMITRSELETVLEYAWDEDVKFAATIRAAIEGREHGISREEFVELMKKGYDNE